MSMATATLVIGAGELGSGVLQALIDTGAAERGELSVLLRPQPDNALKPAAAKLRDAGVNIVQADIATSTEAELAAIFADYSTVICCTGFVGGPGTQRKITSAVLQAGVARYVPWQFGVDYDVIGRGGGPTVWDEQLDVRDLLRAQSTTRWVIISTGMFTSFLFEPWFGVVDLQNAKVHALGSWKYRVTVTDVSDIGRMTAAILAHQPRIEDEVVYIAGDTLEYDEIADAVEQSIGRTVEKTLWEVPHLQSEAAAHRDDVLRQYHLAFARPDGVAWDKSTTFNGQQGLGMIDVQNWLSHHKK